MQAFQQGIQGMPNLTDNDRAILSSSPELAQSVLGEIYKNRFDPNAGLEAQYKRAQINKLNMEANGGGETPSNIREWQQFQKMSPEDQQRYLTMKRADRFYNTGTDYVAPNPLNPGGPPRASIPINNAQKASDVASGKLQGTAAFNLPAFEYSAKNLISKIDGVLNDPYLPNMVGPVAGRLPNISGAANRVQQKMDQIQAQSFLQAYDQLRGAGQISNAEGAKAEMSKNRLQNAKQGTQDWIEAANEFKQDILDLVNLKRQQAAGGIQAPPQQATPAPSVPSAPTSTPPAAGGWSIKRID
jgi:hypothetical protein